MSHEIGDIIEKKMRVEWPVPDFFSHSPEVDKKLVSPVFFFAGLAWELYIYPNGESRTNSVGNVGLFLNRKSNGPPKILTYSLGLRNADGEEEEGIFEDSQTFFGPSERLITHARFGAWGCPRFLERSNLLRRKDKLGPADTLTVTCSIEDESSSDASLTRRLWNLSLNLATVMSTPEDADVTLELPDGKLEAHKMILKSRSPVFASMFSHDMKECQTGEVKIEDADKESFEIVLAYLYTGDPIGLTSENAKDVYRLSHKYELRDLTKCCCEFMRARLSVETICDVIPIAVVYQDQKLMDNAKDYFVGHKEEIKKTDQWKALKEENAKIVCEMLEYTVDKIC